MLDHKGCMRVNPKYTVMNNDIVMNIDNAIYKKELTYTKITIKCKFIMNELFTC